MNEIILIGSGGHARSCIDVINHTGLFKIAGLVEKHSEKNPDNLGYPIIGTDQDLNSLRKKFEFALVAVGQIKSAETRIKLFQKLEDLDYKLPAIISPRSYLSQYSNIDSGTIIMHDVIVNANVNIGKNCIINNKALIEHDVNIGNHCHIATGAIVNGEVEVGDESFLGSGSTTRECISIGDKVLIGAGVTLKKDISSNQVIKN